MTIKNYRDYFVCRVLSSGINRIHCRLTNPYEN